MGTVVLHEINRDAGRLVGPPVVGFEKESARIVVDQRVDADNAWK
jgi:hypothetical protein